MHAVIHLYQHSPGFSLDTIAEPNSHLPDLDMEYEPGCQRMPTAANAMQKCINLSPVLPNPHLESKEVLSRWEMI